MGGTILCIAFLHSEPVTFVEDETPRILNELYQLFSAHPFWMGLRGEGVFVCGGAGVDMSP